LALKKTNTATELWQVTQNWLLQLGNTPNTKYCREEITTHPDYPAITSVVDFLDAGNMKYKAVEADASYIHEFNYPLLAHIRQPGQEYMHIIPNAGEWDKQKEITQYWTGITIFPEKNSGWQNEQNTTYQKSAFKNKIFSAALIAIGLVLFIISAVSQAGVLAVAFGLLSLIGLIISVILLGTELGYQSQIVKQVCGAVSNGGCEKVLKSKYAKGFLGITPADASVLYFSAQFTIYFLSSLYPTFLQSIFLLAYAGIIIAAWSIYTQAVKLKQWCALCLGVAAVLILQTALALVFANSQLLIPNSITPIAAFLILITLLSFILLPTKQLIKTNNTNRQKLVELKKWKTDAGLFITQWQQEQQVDTTIWQNDLVIGNPNAPILITVACNPYCGPCAKAHKQLDDLLYRFTGKLKVQVRLLCDAENETDKRAIAVKAILQKAEIINTTTELQQMLTDWFVWMDFEKWDTKWKADGNIDVAGKLKLHNKWIEEGAIQFTPTFFINGRKLPGRYALKDIEILIPQLEQILTNESVK
jgi:protein-disulfide isomerase/uncharacterized membrane protein